MATPHHAAVTATPQIEGIAKARYTRVSPQKARLVIDLIRGRRAEEARASKGVKGAVRKARKALEQRSKQGQKKKK